MHINLGTKTPKSSSRNDGNSTIGLSGRCDDITLNLKYTGKASLM